jgi:hypothetical protein
VDIFLTAKVSFFEFNADYRTAVGADGLKFSVVASGTKKYTFRAYQGCLSGGSLKSVLHE